MRLLANSAIALLLAAGLASAGEMLDIEFAKPGGVSLTLDAYVPDGKGPFPTVIIVHGGGWVNGTKRSYVTPIFPVLTKAGFAWFTINYRLAPAHKFPAATEDVDAAIRWVRAHAKEYKVDTRRIALMGESAGGHLVAYAGTKRAPGTEVSAVVDFYGAHDLLKREKERGEVTKNMREFLGVDKLDEAGMAKLREASPITICQKGATSFPIHSWHQGRSGTLRSVAPDVRGPQEGRQPLRGVYGGRRSARGWPVGEEPRIPGLQNEDGGVAAPGVETLSYPFIHA